MELRRLPDTELEVLKALWSLKCPAPRAQLEKYLAEKHWASNTFNTYLTRLLEKGYLACEKRGKTNYYSPLVSREDYQAFESKNVLNKLFGSSVKNFVATLAQGGELSQGELDELQHYLDELKGNP